MKLIKRALYLDRLMGLRGSPDIKIITGVRRSGKSKLIEALRTLLLSADDVNVIYIDLLDLSNEPLHEYHALNQYVLSHTQEGVANVLMIDEVQECASFERTINSLRNPLPRRRLFVARVRLVSPFERSRAGCRIEGGGEVGL